MNAPSSASPHQSSDAPPAGAPLPGAVSQRQSVLTPRRVSFATVVLVAAAALIWFLTRPAVTPLHVKVISGAPSSPKILRQYFW